MPLQSFAEKLAQNTKEGDTGVNPSSIHQQSGSGTGGTYCTLLLMLLMSLMPNLELAEPMLAFTIQVLWEERAKEVSLELQWVDTVMLVQVRLRNMYAQI